MAQIKKKVKILEKKPPTKSKWWLWLFLALIVIVAVIFLVKKSSSDANNQIVSDKIELATTKANEVAADIQNSTVNIEEAQSKIEEAQKAVDDANANAKTDKEKQAVAQAQAKMDQARQAIKQKKTSAETKTPIKEEPVEGEQPATKSVVSAVPAKSASEKPVTTPAQSGQSSTSKTDASTTSAPTLPQGTLEEKAKKVIRGDFGNGLERKQSLGSEYNAIQQKVNEMYRKGEVY